MSVRGNHNVLVQLPGTILGCWPKLDLIFLSIICFAFIWRLLRVM